MSDREDWNSNVIQEFRTNEGKVGGPFDAIGSDENKVTVFGAEGELSDWPMLPKRQVAERLWDLIVDRYRKAHPAERPERPARSRRR